MQSDLLQHQIKKIDKMLEKDPMEMTDEEAHDACINLAIELDRLQAMVQKAIQQIKEIESATSKAQTQSQN